RSPARWLRPPGSYQPKMVLDGGEKRHAIWSSRAAKRADHSPDVSAHRSHRENFLLLLPGDLVDPGDVAVGSLLDLLVAAALLILRDLLLLAHRLELVVGLA